MGSLPSRLPLRLPNYIVCPPAEITENIPSGSLGSGNLARSTIDVKYSWQVDRTITISLSRNGSVYAFGFVVGWGMETPKILLDGSNITTETKASGNYDEVAYMLFGKKSNVSSGSHTVKLDTYGYIVFAGLKVVVIETG